MKAKGSAVAVNNFTMAMVGSFYVLIAIILYRLCN